MEKYEYTPKGVCSTKMIFEIDGDIIRSVEIKNGCAGNLLGISKLLKNKRIDEILEAFDGVQCHTRGTSCPDQIAQALKQYRNSKV